MLNTQGNKFLRSYSYLGWLGKLLHNLIPQLAVSMKIFPLKLKQTEGKREGRRGFSPVRNFVTNKYETGKCRWVAFEKQHGSGFLDQYFGISLLWYRSKREKNCCYLFKRKLTNLFLFIVCLFVCSFLDQALFKLYSPFILLWHPLWWHQCLCCLKISKRFEYVSFETKDRWVQSYPWWLWKTSDKWERREECEVHTSCYQQYLQSHTLSQDRGDTRSSLLKFSLPLCKANSIIEDIST